MVDETCLHATSAVPGDQGAARSAVSAVKCRGILLAVMVQSVSSSIVYDHSIDYDSISDSRDRKLTKAVAIAITIPSSEYAYCVVGW